MTSIAFADPGPQGLLGLLNGWLLARRTAREVGQERAAAIAEAIEEVIAGTEPKLRALGHYDRFLWSVVADALDYIAELIARLPPPIDLSRVAWARDPHVNAFFATADDLPLFQSRSKELRDFFQRHPTATHAFAILTLTRKEKQVFGISLQDEIVRRDVALTSIDFTDPTLLGPAATEEEVREEARHCALNLYIGLAKERLARSKAKWEGLDHERLILETRINGLRAQTRQGAEDAAGIREKIAATEERLAANGQERAAMGSLPNRLEAMLKEIHRILADPRGELQLAPSSLRVDRLGIKQEGGQAAGTPANDLSLLECTTATSQRVIALVRCSREELLTLDQIVARVEPYLASQMGIRGS
jgi:hypothetical protein